MRHIERVQYDGAGEWLDVVFDDGRRARLAAGLVYELAGIVAEPDERIRLLENERIRLLQIELKERKAQLQKLTEEHEVEIRCYADSLVEASEARDRLYVENDKLKARLKVPSVERQKGEVNDDGGTN